VAFVSKTGCKRFLGYIIGFGCFFGIVFFSFIEPNLPLPVSGSEHRGDFEFTDVKVSQLSSGRLLWSMTASSSVVEKGGGKIRLKNVTGIFFEGRSPVFRVRAPFSTLNLATSDLVLTESSSVFDVSGRDVFLGASRLEWDSGLQQFEGTQRIRVRSEGVEIHSDYFKAHLPSRTLEISKGSRAHIETEALQK
jgi:hypothetical protein